MKTTNGWKIEKIKINKKWGEKLMNDGKKKNRRTRRKTNDSTMTNE